MQVKNLRSVTLRAISSVALAVISVIAEATAAHTGGQTVRRLEATASNQVAFTPINMIYCTR